MKKDTSALEQELKSFNNFEAFYNENNESIGDISLSECLNEIIESKNLSKSEIIEKSQMNEIYAYQIMSGVKKKPTRNKVLCLAVAMNLTFEEVQNLLKKSGYPTLYAKKPFDCIIIYGLCNKMNVVEINELLFDYDMETLG